MSEGLQKQVKLPGKQKDEFAEFWGILQPMISTELTKDNVAFLTRWADEYQVETLRTRCEKCTQNPASATMKSIKKIVFDAFLGSGGSEKHQKIFLMLFTPPRGPEKHQFFFDAPTFFLMRRNMFF